MNKRKGKAARAAILEGTSTRDDVERAARELRPQFVLDEPHRKGKGRALVRALRRSAARLPAPAAGGFLVPGKMAAAVLAAARYPTALSIARRRNALLRESLKHGVVILRRALEDAPWRDARDLSALADACDLVRGLANHLVQVSTR